MTSAAASGTKQNDNAVTKEVAVLLACVLSLASASQVLLIKLSQVDPSNSSVSDSRDSNYAYDFASVPLLSELIKLAISGFLLYRQPPERRKITAAWWSMRLYIVPAVCYCVHNNLMLMVLGQVTPFTYMLLANVKTATTAVMFRILLGRRLSRLQWNASMLLVIGTLISLINDCSNYGNSLNVSTSTVCKGLLLGFFSAMAGTYTEMFLRANDDSLYWQNVQMYLFGVLSNGLNVTLQGFLSGRSRFALAPSVLLQGYNVYAWLSVLVLACAGMLVSWIMKHTNTIVKVYSNIAGMLVTMMASHYFIGTSYSLEGILGFMTVCIGSDLYYLGLKELFGEKAATELEAVVSAGCHTPSHTRASTHPSLLSMNIQEVARSPENIKGI